MFSPHSHAALSPDIGSVQSGHKHYHATVTAFLRPLLTDNHDGARSHSSHSFHSTPSPAPTDLLPSSHSSLSTSSSSLSWFTSSPPPHLPLWLMYVVSLSAMLIAGSAYNFASWSTHLKARLSFTQSELELIGYCGNWPGFIQPFCGLAINRFHPAVTACIAAGFLLLGYGGLALGVTGWSSVLSSPALLATSNGLVIIGITFIYTLVITIDVQNLPPHRTGVGIAVLVTFFGLSASMFSLLYVYALSSDLLAYFVLSGLLSSSVCLLNACTLRRVGRQAEDVLGEGRLRAGSVLSSASSLSEPSPSSSSSLSSLSFSSSTSLPHTADDSTLLTSPTPYSTLPPKLPLPPPPSSLTDGSFLSVFRILFHLLHSGYFYAYFGLMFLVGGCGYITINNTGAIVASLNDGVADPGFTFACILTLSLGNGLGRLLMGFSDFVPIRRGWFAVMSASLMLSVYAWNVLWVTAKRQWLLSAFFTGLAYGGCWSIVPILTAETEAWPHSLFAFIFGWIAIAPAMASLTFNAVVGALYDAQADADHNCVGKRCWVSSFTMGIGLACIALLTSIALVGWTHTGKKRRKA